MGREKLKLLDLLKCPCFKTMEVLKFSEKSERTMLVFLSYLDEGLLSARGQIGREWGSPATSDP